MFYLLFLIFHYFILTSSSFTSNTFTTTQDPLPGYFPNLGNGFIGYDVGCQCGDDTSSAGNVFLAGTYSGQGSIDPSKRAMIPQHLSFFVANATDIGTGALLEHSWVAELDIEKGIFTNTSTFYMSSEEKVCDISLTWLVHREIKDVMALHIEAISLSVESSCSIQLESCSGELTDQVEMLESVDDSILYRTTTPEVPDGDSMYIYSVFDQVPSTITVSSGDVVNDMFLEFFQSSAWTKSKTFTDLYNFDAYSLDKFRGSVNERKQDYLWSSVLSSHITAWGTLWESGIEISGNETIAAAINASFYYILSAIDPHSPWSISPGGLSKNSYSGHVFWDCETWILPALAPLHPDLALSFAEYRQQRLAAAFDRAKFRGFSDKAAMLPWESAYTGMDVTPVGNYEGNFEIHVTADIPLAMRSIYYWTGNVTWLQEEAWPVIVACSQYLAERVSCVDENCDSYSYMNVQPPDEKAGIVNASVYTNAAAAELLSWAATFDSQHAEWKDIANRMNIPLSDELYPSGNVHPEYEGYDGEPINQADAVLLQFPLLFKMSDDVAFNDLQFYAALTSVPGETKGFYTGDSSYSIAYMMLLRKDFKDEVNDADLKILADDQFVQAFDHLDMSTFFVWKEKIEGGHFNFLTGAGGFLQNCIYGYGGISVEESAMIVDNPLLPPENVESMKIRGVHFHDNLISLFWNESSLEIQLLDGQLSVYAATSQSNDFKMITTLTNTNSKVVVSVSSKVKLI